MGIQSINFALVGLLVLILALYRYLLYRERKNIVVVTDHLSGKSKVRQTVKQMIIRQKIRHKEISYICYVARLVISFALGGFMIYRIIAGVFDLSVLGNAFSVSAGVLATVGLRKLYQRCAFDVDQLKDA